MFGFGGDEAIDLNESEVGIGDGVEGREGVPGDEQSHETGDEVA